MQTNFCRITRKDVCVTAEGDRMKPVSDSQEQKTYVIRTYNTFHVGGSERKALKRLNEIMGKIHVPLPLLSIKRKLIVISVWFSTLDS